MASKMWETLPAPARINDLEVREAPDAMFPAIEVPNGPDRSFMVFVDSIDAAIRHIAGISFVELDNPTPHDELAALKAERDAARAELAKERQERRLLLGHPTFGALGATLRANSVAADNVVLRREASAVAADSVILRRALDAARAELARATYQMEGWAESAGSWAAENASLRAELQAAHDLLAKFTAANVPKPEPAKPSPFREFPGDRRRIGA
jgi:hypothetical protein